ncbi:uncharacterized protein LOC129907278 [Episyrphus balteatus]|uniref:uncharacterized protein LOC129907278 n=1 Tax=Episyrphus balteatus TaxID=286459 RepID=UPI00248691D9|nr:uncharacterized protein LOC129907278 [Episyrphus balteatus]
MEYETSYDMGLKPFNHDKNRGKWASSKDFIFACAGHAFKADTMMVLPYFIFEEVGIFALIPYFVILAVCVVPIVFMQSFLGQFSSTGFISVFRISPLFKGIGYVSLVVNFLTLTYYSIFSAIPLFYFFHSLRPTIPWSCDGFEEWTKNITNSKSICLPETAENSNLYLITMPSVDFLLNHLNITGNESQFDDYSFSLQLAICTCIIWGIVTYVILNSTELIGKVIRYSFIGMVAIMILCLIRFSLLPGAMQGFWQFVLPETYRLYWDTWMFLPSMVLATLGPGWGSILTMASFNNFKTNIFTYSWVLCLAQFGLMIGMSFLSTFMKYFMDTIRPKPRLHYPFRNIQWAQFLSIGTGLTFMELPHFWSLLFFSMLILGSLNILIGVYFLTLLSKYAIVTQVILNFLLLLVVLWIYGRERFQRDLKFMTSRVYSTWMVNIVRFVAPLILLCGLFIGLLIFVEFDDDSPTNIGILETVIFLSICVVTKLLCVILMEYETSYDTGSKPFNHDKHRGKWESSKDFLFACIGHAFKLDTVAVLPMVIIETLGIYALIPYFIILSVCVVPIVFIQTFLGQFSSTGYISVFRIAPLFKGIGFVSLTLNFVTLTYYSAFSALPLLYFVHSMRPTIPWSCVGAKQWMNINETICDKDESDLEKVPSVEFFRHNFNFRKTTNGTTFSFQLMIYTAIIWVIATLILLKSTEFIGRFMRYSFIIITTVMGLCLLRFIFLPGAFDALWRVLDPFSNRRSSSMEYSIFIPLLVFSTLGPGWGSILTMASFNDFKTNIYRFSWLMCLGHLGVITGMGLIGTILMNVLRNFGTRSRTIRPLPNWTQFLRTPTSLTFMELPNFWSMLFFGMFVLGSLNLLIIQLLSLFTSIFDEFENLREIKRHFVLGTVAVLGLISMLFCSNVSMTFFFAKYDKVTYFSSQHGMYLFEVLSKLSILMQVILNLFLLLVVLWVYGRERFQRDLNFMTSQIYSTWMVYVVRFVAPIFLFIGFCIAFFWLVVSLIFHRDTPSSYPILLISAILFSLLTWCLIPSYCIYKTTQTLGSICVRLKRSVRPTDWYPADPIDKQNYEERFSSTDTAHPLTVLEEEI